MDVAPSGTMKERLVVDPSSVENDSPVLIDELVIADKVCEGYR